MDKDTTYDYADFLVALVYTQRRDIPMDCDLEPMAECSVEAA